MVMLVLKATKTLIGWLPHEATQGNRVNDPLEFCGENWSRGGCFAVAT